MRRSKAALTGAVLSASAVLVTLPTTSLGAPVAVRTNVSNLVSTTSAVTTPGPFGCTTPTVFLAEGAPTQLYDSLYGSGSTTFHKIGVPSAWTYNALGYDPSNRFLYAISMQASGSKSPVGHLLKIADTGAVTNLGALSGDSYLSAHGATNGAFDPQGNLWVATPGDKQVDEVDATSVPPKILRHINTSAPWEALDLTYADGFMWGMATVSSIPKIFRLNLSTGGVTSYAAPAGVSASSAFGGAWTYGNDNLGFNSNSTGNLYQLSVTTPTTTPKFKLVSTYTGPPATSQDDAAACVPPEVDLSITKSGPATVVAGGTVTWNLKVSNKGPGNSSGYVINDTVPSGVTKVASSSAGCKVSGNAVTCTEGELGDGKAAVDTVTGKAPSLTGACITNVATVSGNEKDPTVADNTSSVKTCTTAPANVLQGVVSVWTDREGYCAVLSSGGVACWGDGRVGELGDGQFYTTGNDGSAVPVQVVGIGGTGTLAGVKSLASSGGSYCALLNSGGVDCWGNGQYGELGDGQFYTTGNPGSATPVQVVGVGGTGTLAGVASLAPGYFGYCAMLTSGGVDCWGNGEYGSLGDGQYYRSAPYGSAVPVTVEGVNGSGTLGGVVRLYDFYGTNCVILKSAGVDCWGDGWIGNGGSAAPFTVQGVGGQGTLDGVASLDSSLDFNSFVTICAVLTTGGVDCWGWGQEGELGNGVFYTTPAGSGVPVQVEAVGGTGTLSGVASLGDTGDGLCAVLTSGGIDCWGAGSNGELGNGAFNNSAVPVRVNGVGGTGTLTGVAGVTGSWNGSTYCARLTSGGADCWGYGEQGELGNGTFYSTSPKGSDTPVQVVPAAGSGSLGGVAGLTSAAFDATSYCARLSSTEVDCWGNGLNGQLGDGSFYPTAPNGSAVPVQVKAIATAGPRQ